MPSLIVPRGYATGKSNVRPVDNPFAAMVRARKSPHQKRYRGKAWKGVGRNEILNEHPGRKSGQLAGVWVNDLTERRKIVVLCDLCQSKFYYKRVQYYRDEFYGPRANATCDGCKEHTTKGRMYLPEERLLEPSGVSRPGQCWSPS